MAPDAPAARVAGARPGEDVAPPRQDPPAEAAAPPGPALPATVAQEPVHDTEATQPHPPLPGRPLVRRPDDVGSEPPEEGAAPRPRRVRDRLARRIVAGQRSEVRPVLEPLAALHRQSHPKADLALLQRAYDVAEAAHATQTR